MSAMELPGQIKPRPTYGPYILGALLVYAMCVLGAGRILSSNLRDAISLGLVGGLCPFIPVAAVHFFIQKGLQQVLMKYAPSNSKGGRAYLWLNLPALLWLLLILAPAILPPGNEAKMRVFKAVTKQDPPASIQMVGFERERGMNDGHCSLVFRISESDFYQLITSLNLTVEKSDLDDQALNKYRKIAAKSGASTFRFEAPGKLYSIKADNGTLHSSTSIIVGTNCQEVLLINTFF